jgi:Ca2+-binding RTX toxin-like protein
VRAVVRFALAGAACGAVLVSALAAANTVPATKAGRRTSAITVDSLKPKPACAGITVAVLVTGGNGANTFDLVLGTAGPDTLRGNNRDDCIVGGGGNDSLRGDAGVDVCIGGPGTDTFQASCETQIQ